jgi:DNA polymerase sigma
MRLTCGLDGMERVICVSHAKVPIVKIWDPDLQLACDMNVNNTLALENTRMVRTYVEIDERVRPLAMIVKYWTRRRILNDAGVCACVCLCSTGLLERKKKDVHR